MLLSLLVIAGLLGAGSPLHCHEDEDLENLETYTKELSPKPSNMTYWKNDHMQYFVYGTFGEDASSAVLQVGVYEDDEPLYVAKVNCGNNKWTVSVRGRIIQEGTLNEPCQPNTYWDLGLKVDQKKKAYFLFNAQQLDNEAKRGRADPSGLFPAVEQLPTGVTMRNATHLRAGAYRDSALTRVAYGKCWTIPHELKSNCQAAQDFVLERAKKPNVQLGLNGVFWKPICYAGNTRYWHWQQTAVHYDQDSTKPRSARKPRQNAWCCCVDMTTGDLVKGKEVIEITSSYSGNLMSDWKLQSDSSGSSSSYYRYEWKTCAQKRSGESTCDHFPCESAMDFDIMEEFPISNTEEGAK